MPGQNKFSQAITSGNFVVTCELDPPKGIDPGVLDDKLATLQNKVQAVIISDNPKAEMRLSPLAVGLYLREKGLDPILTFSCRDRNRLALQSDLLAAASLGLKNILAVTGDYITWGDHPGAKPVYDLDSVQLLQAVSALGEGKDLNGNSLQGKAPSFTVGAVVPLVAEPLAPHVPKLRKKLAAGVNFLISHPVFDLASVEDFFKLVPELPVPLIATVCLLKGEQIQPYVPGSIPGLWIPDAVLKEFQGLNPDDVFKNSLEKSSRLIEAIKKDGRFQGVHLMLGGEEERVAELL